MAVLDHNRGQGRATRKLAVVAMVAAAAAFPASVAAAPPPVEPYGTHDFGGFRNILPPGEGTNANIAQIGQFEANGTRPPHNQDQLSMYNDLVYAAPGLAPSQVSNYYKDATFGVRPGEVEGQPYSPRDDVTIVRDQFGVPHIYGSSRAGAMFGAGYAAAQDRLFLMDVLRHAARAELSSFVGGSPGNQAMDESVWADTPYNESELQQQYDQAPQIYGQRGVQIQSDVQNYIAGINQFISEACADPSRLPGEYDLIQPSQSICLPGHEFTVDDVIAIGSLVAGIFGKGGGNELGSALTLESAQKQFGSKQGQQVWQDFRSANDPEAPLTVLNGSFPYEVPPKHPQGVAMPDPGSVQYANVVESTSGPPSPSQASSTSGASAGDMANLGRNLESALQQSGHSNALLVPASQSKDGQPLAVMGPQVSYFSPQILSEEDIHAPSGPTGPGVDARGASFPGTNLYVELGHGRNYAWSATSAGQDIVDTYAVRLCNQDGSAATLDSTSYRFEGQCIPFDVLERQNCWNPSPADQTPSGCVTLRTYRSKLGVVIARATIGGKPYAYTKLRDTYFHEVDPSALGFADFNEPNKMRTPADFMRSASKISLTFNWFYINQNHIAYYNSGQNPERPSYVDPSLPTMGRKKFLWKGYNPDQPQFSLSDLHRQLTKNHPQTVDQRYIVSWNNKQAHDYHAADDNFGFQSLFRSQMLSDRVKKLIAGQKKTTLPKLIGAMEDAGTVDFRGAYVLPWALKVIETKSVSDPAVNQAIQTLTAWYQSGAHRIDRNQDGSYENSDAIRIMDAWYPRLVQAEFEPTLGHGLFQQLQRMIGLDDSPHGHLGSSYDGGWYGYAQKDLRTILGKPVQGGYSRVYCGGGNLGQCRDALLSSLQDALAHDSSNELYGTDGCTLSNGVNASPQMCYDAIHSTAVGAITQPPFPWVNRPTFQQAVEVGGGH